VLFASAASAGLVTQMGCSRSAARSLAAAFAVRKDSRLSAALSWAADQKAVGLQSYCA